MEGIWIFTGKLFYKLNVAFVDKLVKMEGIR